MASGPELDLPRQTAGSKHQEHKHTTKTTPNRTS
jgi:hypothetical protein